MFFVLQLSVTGNINMCEMVLEAFLYKHFLDIQEEITFINWQVAFFVEPNHECVVECLPTCKSAANPPKYVLNFLNQAVHTSSVHYANSHGHLHTAYLINYLLSLPPSLSCSHASP